MPVIKSRFVKDGIALISGNMWGQAIAFAAWLIMARLFSPEDIGLYNIFYSYIELLIIVSTCKYELATVVSDDDHEAAAVSRLALRINTVVSALLLAAALLLYAVGQHSSLVIPSFALLIPPMVFFCGTSRVYAALFNRYREFRQIALSEVVGSTSGVIFKVLFGIPQLLTTVWHSLGLPLGTVLGKAASNINYVVAMRRLEVPLEASREEQRTAARKFRNFPLYTMPKDLLNSLSFNLPLLWLALWFDKAEVGLYALALTFTFRPVNIFNTAFEKLLYVRCAEKVRNGQPIKRDIVRFLAIVNAVALPLSVVAFLFGGEIFGFFFGSRWSDCEFYIRCLLPWVYVALSSTSLMFIANVFSRQRTEFAFYIVLFVMRLAAMVTGIVRSDFRLAIMLFAISGALVSVALMLWYLRLVGRYENRA